MTKHIVSYSNNGEQTVLRCQELGIAFRLAQFLGETYYVKARSKNKCHYVIIFDDLTMQAIQQAITVQLNDSCIQLEQEQWKDL